MEVSINFWAVLLAALSTMVVGAIWYTPKVFGDVWMKLSKVKLDASRDKRRATRLYIGAFLVSVITAIVLASFAYIAFQAWGGSFLADTLAIAFLGWLGFTAARIYTHDAFENRRKKLTLLNVSHEFVTIMIMALIIGLIH